jgi:hypothetical protein
VVAAVVSARDQDSSLPQIGRNELAERQQGVALSRRQVQRQANREAAVVSGRDVSRVNDAEPTALRMTAADVDLLLGSQLDPGVSAGWRFFM